VAHRSPKTEGKPPVLRKRYPFARCRKKGKEEEFSVRKKEKKKNPVPADQKRKVRTCLTGARGEKGGGETPPSVLGKKRFVPKEELGYTPVGGGRKKEREKGGGWSALPSVNWRGSTGFPEKRRPASLRRRERGGKRGEGGNGSNQPVTWEKFSGAHRKRGRGGGRPRVGEERRKRKDVCLRAVGRGDTPFLRGKKKS